METKKIYLDAGYDVLVLRATEKFDIKITRDCSITDDDERANWTYNRNKLLSHDERLSIPVDLCLIFDDYIKRNFYHELYV